MSMRMEISWINPEMGDMVEVRIQLGPQNELPLVTAIVLEHPTEGVRTE
jgi:hypothetical protein